MTETIVTRRLLAYEFVIRTSRSVGDNAARLDNFLARTERPKGFFLSDPRLTGRVDGSTFTLRPWNGAMWGSEVSAIDGYFVPSETGSDVVVRVGPSELSRWLWLPLGIFLIATLWSLAHSVETLATVFVLAVVVSALLVVPPLFHGSNAARTLSSIFGE